MKKCGVILLLLLATLVLEAQPGNCILKPPQFTIHFGSGTIREVNTSDLSYYDRVGSSCPSDGHYSYVPSTARCFNNDWHTLPEDHTVGDSNGNMLLVNAAPFGGTFMNIPITGLKENTIYEVGVWVMNLCRPTDKCPSLLLPSLNIRLETATGKIIANIVTRDLPRVPDPRWDQHRAYFTTPAVRTELRLVMADNAPGGCGNDFALDDITFRECVPPPPKTIAAPKKNPPVKQQPKAKETTKKTTTAPPKKVVPAAVVTAKKDTSIRTIAVVTPAPKIFPAAPTILKTRENALVRRIETEAGKISINVYDNGEIDGDTVSIYHNNVLVSSRQRLSQKPITVTIDIDASQPHHELIMVAENLGSIPPNTSVMIVSTPGKRYQVYISSSEQKNAKVVFDLKVN